MCWSWRNNNRFTCLKQPVAVKILNFVCLKNFENFKKFIFQHVLLAWSRFWSRCRTNLCSIFKFVYRQLTPRVLLFFKRCFLCSVRQCFHNIKYSCYQDSFVVQSWFCGWGKRLIYGQIHMFLDGSRFKSSCSLLLN